jgi:hypothetical protein
MAIRQGIEDLAALENAFGLPAGFIDALRNEDDWSLIIKSHALLESACADMLCHQLGKYELADVFAQLEMSNKRYGKAAFISALSLLSKAERRFISELSELRNLVVHNASNVAFSLRDYLLGLSGEKLTRLLASLNLRLKSITISGETLEGNDLALRYPALVIWSSLTACLGSIYIQDVFAIKRNELIKKMVSELRKEGPIKIQHADLPISISSRRTR